MTVHDLGLAREQLDERLDGEHEIAVAMSSGDEMQIDGNHVDEVEPRLYLHIVTIDVGQGESALIRYVLDGLTLLAVLVDGGLKHYADDAIIPTLDALGVERLDAVVCSHYDADHLGGLGELPARGSPVLFERTLVELQEDPITRLRDRYWRRVRLKSGDRITLGTEVLDRLEQLLGRRPDLAIDCVFSQSQGADDENDKSIALRVRLDQFTFFTGGDLTSDKEDGLFRAGDENLHTCVIKCGHHGSKHSTSVAMLERASPRAAIISAGRHTYCHPHDDTIDRLLKRDNLRLYSTNCCYNRAGINPDFLAREVEHERDIIAVLTRQADAMQATPRKGLPPATAEWLEDFIDSARTAVAKTLYGGGDPPPRTPQSGGKPPSITAEHDVDLYALLRSGFSTYQSLQELRDSTKVKSRRGRCNDDVTRRTVVAGSQQRLGNVELWTRGGCCEFAVGYWSSAGACVQVPLGLAEAPAATAVARVAEYTGPFTQRTGFTVRDDKSPLDRAIEKLDRAYQRWADPLEKEQQAVADELAENKLVKTAKAIEIAIKNKYRDLDERFKQKSVYRSAEQAWRELLAETGTDTGAKTCAGCLPPLRTLRDKRASSVKDVKDEITRLRRDENEEKDEYEGARKRKLDEIQPKKPISKRLRSSGKKRRVDTH